MPIKLEVNYSKKLGLPRYSSHSHSITVTVELDSVEQIGPESARLHKQLQKEVDKHLRNVGYLGEAPAPQPFGKAARGKIVPLFNIGEPTTLDKGKAKLAEMVKPASGWSCSDTQRAMILNLVDEYDLGKRAVETLAKQIHGVGVRALNRHQAELFILELQQQHDTRAEPGS